MVKEWTAQVKSKKGGKSEKIPNRLMKMCGEIMGRQDLRVD